MIAYALTFVLGFVAGTMATWATLTARRAQMEQTYERRLSELRAEAAEARAEAVEARSESLVQLHARLSRPHPEGWRSKP